MILTGAQILEEVQQGRIVIAPFDPERLEPNSYGFSLGSEVIQYLDDVVDARTSPRELRCVIGDEGFLFEPGKHYLGHTAERIGSHCHAATLYANRSISSLGVWIQMSAPLGHTGAIIPWTLEVKVAHPVRLFARQPIGKVAFWQNCGETSTYSGRYVGSESVVASRLSRDVRNLKGVRS